MLQIKESLQPYAVNKINGLHLDAIDQNKLWVHYDDEADSLVIYLTGKPERAISVALDRDTYLKVNPITGDIVGFHVEAWQRAFLPDHADLQEIWDKLTPRSVETDWPALLRVLALWLIFMLKSAYFVPPSPQPA